MGRRDGRKAEPDPVCLCWIVQAGTTEREETGMEEQR
jgi:hypothetical protein